MCDDTTKSYQGPEEGARRFERGGRGEPWGTRRREVAQQGGAGGGRQEPGGAFCRRRDGARIVTDISRIVSGVRKSLLGRGGCFRKGCSKNVKRPKMGSFANSRYPKKHIANWSHEYERGPEGPQWTVGAQPAGFLGGNT